MDAGLTGPQHCCSDMKEMTGVEKTCREVRNGRIYPTIFTHLDLPRDAARRRHFRVHDVITRKDATAARSRMANTWRTATTRKRRSRHRPNPGKGRPAVSRPSTGGSVPRSFWLGEEMRPRSRISERRVRMYARHVQPARKRFHRGSYETIGSLRRSSPSAPVASRKQSRRGIARRGFSISS